MLVFGIYLSETKSAWMRFSFFFFVYGGAPPPFPSKVDYKMMAVGLEEKVSRSSFELIDGGRRLQELCRKVHLTRDI